MDKVLKDKPGSIIESYFKRSFCDSYKLDREYSWKNCYDAFRCIKENSNLSEEEIDYLALRLGFYLASWGMYRGSSFILKYSYKIHEGAIKIISTHSGLYGADICTTAKKINEILILKDELQKYYSQSNIVFLRKRKIT